MGPRTKKILCLGVSYPSLPSQMRHLGLDEETYPATCEAAVDCVSRGILTQMDGRDLARCIATEKECRVHVYCVSQEKGAQYRPDRHLDGNFNRPSFIRKLQAHFPVEFDSILLDYFWIPQGWDASHWKQSFFSVTLPGFAQAGILKPRAGAIYLPFCFHCFREVVAHSRILLRWYNVRFLRKDDLHHVPLWRGTQCIDTGLMQKVLGKRIDQEEIYCTFGPDHLKAMDHPKASKKELEEILYGLEDFADIRFIVLDPIVRPDERIRGKFVGLLEPHLVQRGFFATNAKATPKQQRPRKRRAAVVTPDSTCVDEETPSSLRPKRLFRGRGWRRR